MTPIEAELRRLLEEARAQWSEEDVLRAARVSTDLAALAARAAAGEDVEAELAHAKAAALNIAAAQQIRSGEMVHHAVVGAIAGVLRAALLGAV